MTKRLLNLPNLLTASRILILPLLAIAMQFHRGEIAFVIFVIACITDFLDGWIARRERQESPVGKLMDPVADKMLVSLVIIFLTASPEHQLNPWLGSLLLGREFLVSGLRSMAATLGLVIPAGGVGKSKMISQMVGLGLMMLSGVPLKIPHTHEAGNFFLWLSVVLSYWSMALYLKNAYKALKTKL